MKARRIQAVVPAIDTIPATEDHCDAYSIRQTTDCQDKVRRTPWQAQDSQFKRFRLL